jgi:tetratricopeptide (TPR) repeat protein
MEDVKEKEFKECVEKRMSTYLPIINVCLDSLYNLYIKNDETAINGLYFNLPSYLYYVGNYYYYFNTDKTKMLKYLKMDIELNNDSNSMNSLGYYFHITRNIPEMLKYYLMAIEKGNVNAMYNLGGYYQENNKVLEMIKYYSLAMDLKHKQAFVFYISYYIKNNIDIPNEKIKQVRSFLREIGYELIQDNMLKSIVNFAIRIQDSELFMNLYNKNPLDIVFKKFHPFYLARKEYAKYDCCPICTDDCDLIPYDCFRHRYCVICYFQIKECCLCKVPKNPYFQDMFDMGFTENRR